MRELEFVATTVSDSRFSLGPREAVSGDHPRRVIPSSPAWHHGTQIASGNSAKPYSRPGVDRSPEWPCAHCSSRRSTSARSGDCSSDRLRLPVSLVCRARYRGQGLGGSWAGHTFCALSICEQVLQKGSETPIGLYSGLDLGQSEFQTAVPLSTKRLKNVVG
jgi:hypothetical protein